MTRMHGCLIVALLKVYFFIVLVTQNTEAYPHQVEERPGSSHEFVNENSETPSTSNDSNARRFDDVTKLVERAFRNGELLDENEWSGHHYQLNSGFQRNFESFQRNTTMDQQAMGLQEQRRLSRDQDGASLEHMQSDGKIVFPTDDDVTNQQKFDMRRVPVCHGLTYCERSPYYPENVVNEAILRNTSLKYLASVDVVSDVVQRIDVTDDVPLCVSTEQVVYPKSAENKRKEWLFVVNQDNLKQGVRIETCVNEDAECSVIDGLPSGYKSACKQKYIYRQLVAVSNDGEVVPEMFRFPSSCCCHVKFTGNPLTRMGINLEGRSQTTSAQRHRRK